MRTILFSDNSLSCEFSSRRGNQKMFEKWRNRSLVVFFPPFLVRSVAFEFSFVLYPRLRPDIREYSSFFALALESPFLQPRLASFLMISSQRQQVVPPYPFLFIHPRSLEHHLSSITSFPPSPLFILFSPFFPSLFCSGNQRFANPPSIFPIIR